MSHWRQFAPVLIIATVIGAASGGLVAWCLVRFAAPATQPVINAQQIILRDKLGHIGARIAWEHDQPGLWLFDRADHVRSSLFLEPNGVPDLYLYDSNNVGRAALNLFDSGVPNLAFVDAEGKSMVLTEFDKDHAYNITFEAIGESGSQVLSRQSIRADARGWHGSETSERAKSH
jgi:hypothetical protein